MTSILCIPSKNFKPVMWNGFCSVPNDLASLYNEFTRTCLKHFGLVCHLATTLEVAGILFVGVPST